MLSKFITRALTGAMILAASSSLVLACISTPKNPPATEIYCAGIINGQEVVQVVLRDYTTFAASSGNCSCALNIPVAIGTVTSAQIVLSGTNIPLAGFNFSPNQNAGFFPGSSDFQGFSTAVNSVVSAGQNVDLVFFVVSNKKGLCTNVADYFRRVGLVAASDAAAENGKPIGKHMTFFKTERVKVGKYDECRKRG